MTKGFIRIMSGIVCFLLVALALRGWVAGKKNATPASAGVVEVVESPVASVTVSETTNFGPIVVHDKGGTVRYQSLTSKAPVAPRNPYIQ